MREFSGLFDLQTPYDLLKKFQYEYEKLEEYPLNQYIAFNFFVTAEHMLDWLYPDNQTMGDNRKKRKEEREKEIALCVCWDIASGAKHFKVLGRHDSAQDARVRQGGFQANIFQPDTFQTLSLVIELKGTAAQKLGQFIEVPKLARKVCDYWENHEDLAVY